MQDGLALEGQAQVNAVLRVDTLLAQKRQPGPQGLTQTFDLALPPCARFCRNRPQTGMARLRSLVMHPDLGKTQVLQTLGQHLSGRLGGRLRLNLRRRHHGRRH